MRRWVWDIAAGKLGRPAGSVRAQEQEAERKRPCDDKYGREPDRQLTRRRRIRF